MDTIIAHFFVFLASISLCICALVFVYPPKAKLQLSKKSKIIRVCLSFLILVAFAAVLFFFARQFILSLLVAYGLSAAAIIFSVLQTLFTKNRNKLKSFWKQEIAPCYPLAIVVLAVICVISISDVNNLKKQVQIKESEDWNSGYESGYSDGHEDGYDEARLDYSDDYQSGYSDGYSDAEIDYYDIIYSETADDPEAEYDRGYECGYDDGYSDGYNAASAAISSNVNAESFEAGYEAGFEDGFDEGYGAALDD